MVLSVCSQQGLVKHVRLELVLSGTRYTKHVQDMSHQSEIIIPTRYSGNMATVAEIEKQALEKLGPGARRTFIQKAFPSSLRETFEAYTR